MDNLFSQIHSYFNAAVTDENILKYKTNNKQIKCDLKYLIFYKFLNSFCTKEQAYEKVNKYIDYSRTSLYRQEKQISLDFYKMLNENIKKICNKHFIAESKHRYSFMAVDGTYSNGINYENSLTLGFFDVLNDIPIDLTYFGNNSKNKEVQKLKVFIEDNLNVFKNKVLILDRCYFCYYLMHFLINNNIKFIIRCKGNCQNLKLNKVTKDKQLIALIKDKSRIIHYNEKTTKVIKISHKSKLNKQIKEHVIKINNNCTLISNLSKYFNNSQLLNLYKKRWNVETYFKLIKGNFNFQHLTNKTKDEIEKQFCCIEIICSICKAINSITIKNSQYATASVLEDFIIKCNETKLIRFIKDIILEKVIVNKKIEIDNTKNQLKKYTHIRKYKRNQSNPRSCKTPFMKWYIKAYSNDNEICKIVKAIDEGTLISLNKNLKSKSKNYKILQTKIIK